MRVYIPAHQSCITENLHNKTNNEFLIVILFQFFLPNFF